MKIKVGMYVRTYEGIFKIYAIAPKEDNYHKLILSKNGTLSIGDTGFITKANYKLIKLIKTGDYVNGYLVTTASDNTDSIYIDLKDNNGLRTKLYNKDIQTVLTKEQFEINSYKAGV